MSFSLGRRLLLALGCLPALGWAGCGPPAPADIEAGQIRIARPPPGQALIGWIRMTGAQWDVEVDGAPVPVWPERHGVIPLHVGHTGDAQVRLPMRHLAGPGSSPPEVTLDCVAADSEPALRFARLAALARDHAHFAVGSDPLGGVRLLARLAVALFRAADQPEAQRWLAQQALLLARLGRQSESVFAWAEWLRERAQREGDGTLGNHAQLVAGQSLLLLDPERAKAMLLQARARFAAEGDAYYSNVALQELCLRLRLDGQPERAVACYAEAIGEHLRLGESNSALRTQLNRATALSSMGRYAEAQQQLVEAEEVALRSSDPALRAALQRQRAQFHTWRGQFDAALVLLRALRRYYDEEAMDLFWSAHTDFLIGTNFLLAGEPVRAGEYYADAEQRIAGIGHDHLRVRIRLARAVALSALGRPNEAVEVARSAAAELSQASDLMLEQSAWTQLAEVLLDVGRADEAAAALRRFPSEPTPRLRLRRSLIAAELGLPDEGGPDWRTEVDAALAADQLLLALRIAERLVHELAASGQQDAALDEVDRLAARVLPVIRALKSPALRDALSGQLHGLIGKPLQFRPPGPLEPAEAERVRQLLWQLAQASASPQQVEDDGLLLALERQITQELLPGGSGPETAARSLHLALVGGATPGVATRPGQTVSVSPLRLGAGQQYAAPLLGKRAGGWLVFDGAGWAWWPMDVGALRAVRGELLEALAGGHADADRLQALSIRLRDALGLQRWLSPEAESLWLGMHRELAALPFSLALPEGMQPSVGWVLAPGNVRRTAPTALRALGVSAVGTPGLAALPAVSAELDAVAEVWAGRLTAQADPAAGRPALMQALARGDALVHLAAHGRASLSHYEGSGLWLVDAQGGPDFVSAYRLRTAPVAAPLVVLSACETGQGAGRVGVGIGSVAANLAEAGAGSVVGARWAVGDRAAQAFSVAFHQALRADPSRPEQAVQQAVGALRRTPALRNPTHWAGWFVLSRGVPAPG